MLLGVYPKELKTYTHVNTRTRMWTAALFLIAKTWKHPRCPSAGEQTTYATSRQWAVIQHNKEMSYKPGKHMEEP